MIDPEPAWTRQFDSKVSSWSSHVWLHGAHAVGQWYALERETGEVVWRRDFEAADRIAGIAGNVIVATKAINGQPRVPGEGCHALDLATGTSLWSKPGRFRRKRAVAPVEINEREVQCEGGDVLDLRTGERIGSAAPRSDERWFGWRRTEADELFETALVGSHRGPPVAVAPGCLLEYLLDQPLGHGLQGRDAAGEPTWRFVLSSTPYVAGSAHRERRLVSPWFYYLVGEQPPMRPIDPEFPKYFEYVTSERHLLCIDARTGACVQDVSLGIWNRCAIEDADAQGILLSYDESVLAYHARA